MTAQHPDPTTGLSAEERAALLDGRKRDGESERDRLARVAGEIVARREREAAERVVAGVRAWCALNEIAEPPLDWAGLGEYLDRAAAALASGRGAAGEEAGT